MPSRRSAAPCWIVALTVAAWAGVVAADDRPRPVDYGTQVRPILARACTKCHGPEGTKGGLRLDARASALAGGDSGEPAITPGDVAASPLLDRVSSADPGERMPPKGERLTVAEVDLLRRWVAEGAKWPESNATAATARAEMVVTEKDREHWAFRPLRPVMPPRVDRRGWGRTTIDDFLLGALAAEGLAPTPEADRRTLIRRATFDLTGLPPSPEEIEAFVADKSSDAYGRLVDRLLASPHHGERWGRHWLDVARHADSDGYEGDRDRKDAWRYRDFVIRALNEDMPFDRFVRWQVAGDEYAPGDAAAVAATGFATAAPCQDTTPADTDENKAKIRHDELDNIVATAGSAFLGLTVGCARCHDHKFDPIPTRDYYRMVAAFASSERREAPLSKPHRDLELWLAERRRLYREAKMAELKLTDEEKFWLRQPEHFFVPIQIDLYKKYGKKIEPTDEGLHTWLGEADRATLKGLESAASGAKGRGADPSARGLVLLDRGAQPGTSYLLARGSVAAKKEAVTFGFLQVLTRDATPEDFLARARSLVDAKNPPVMGTTLRRAALAEWLVDPGCGAGGLLARAIVNRLWQHHFGEGLARTPDDLGTTGDRPSHPELLDWLAGELIRGGWRLKPIHRLIVTSAAYRQGTASDPAKAAIDPDNRLLWRRRPARLEAEALRDAMLASSGRLDPAMYGPPFRPPIPAEAIATRSKDAYPANIKDDRSTWRRSVYAFVKRSVSNPWAEVFDAPDSTAACGRRNATAVPTQNLALLNDPFVRGCARDLAARASKEGGPTAEGRLARAYALALGRPPREDESKAALEFLARADAEGGLVDLCHVLFTLNEFLYVD